MFGSSSPACGASDGLYASFITASDQYHQPFMLCTGGSTATRKLGESCQVKLSSLVFSGLRKPNLLHFMKQAMTNKRMMTMFLGTAVCKTRGLTISCRTVLDDRASRKVALPLRRLQQFWSPSWQAEAAFRLSPTKASRRASLALCSIAWSAEAQRSHSPGWRAGVERDC